METAHVPEQTLIVLEDTSDILISHAGDGGTRHADLARRVREALADTGREAELLPCGDLRLASRERLEEATLLVVGPVECVSTSGDEDDLLSALEAVRSRLIVLSEDVESEGYGSHFGLPVSFDAVLDVGFVSQEEKHTFGDVPYRFVADGPTRREEWVIGAVSPNERSIPWAVVGYRIPEHVGMIVRLVQELGPAGLVMAPDPYGTRDLARVLASTNYFVWGAWGNSGYCESWRYLSALCFGAVPCKVDDSDRTPEAPGIFHSVESLCEELRGGDFRDRYEAARSFYLSRGSLGERLEEALRGV